MNERDWMWAWSAVRLLVQKLRVNIALKRWPE